MAVNDVSLDVKEGVTLGIVGQSGSGKTTLAHIMVGIIKPDSGVMRYNGEQYSLNKNIQMVFQHPDTSLNPRLTVYSMLKDLHINRTEATHLMDIIGLDSSYLSRYPSQMSGGEKQRVSIARALALHPKLIIADEPVSSLDVSVQAQILNLIKRLKTELNVTFVLISHELAVVSWLCDEVAVMHKGCIVEQGKVEYVLNNPQDSYTRELLATSALT
ncbi:hypothetical protein AGMMS49941_12270 [Deferribacterales bacterium]|nr:hypothetical protein AGMMS49941_12270 [Deferribacterales bacterium]